MRKVEKSAADGNNIRNWRLYRNLATQQALADLTVAHDPSGRGIQRGAICKLESGEVRYNEDQIDILAAALRVAPRDLIGTNPFSATDIFALYAGLSERKKRKAMQLIAALKR